jgi:hypothetical protein
MRSHRRCCCSTRSLLGHSSVGASMRGSRTGPERSDCCHVGVAPHSSCSSFFCLSSCKRDELIKSPHRSRRVTKLGHGTGGLGPRDGAQQNVANEFRRRTQSQFQLLPVHSPGPVAVVQLGISPRIAARCLPRAMLSSHSANAAAQSASQPDVVDRAHALTIAACGGSVASPLIRD